jgi:hypothetical protein
LEDQEKCLVIRAFSGLFLQDKESAFVIKAFSGPFLPGFEAPKFLAKICRSGFSKKPAGFACFYRFFLSPTN